MNSGATYVLECAGVEVRVTRKRVRRMNLRVAGDGAARMSVPWHVGRAEAAAFLAAHEEWLRGALARAAARREATEAARPSGLVPLWGKLVSWEDAPEELWRAEVAARLGDAAARAEAVLGVHASGWQLRDMKTRWGSCTPATGKIRINIRLAAYPATCLDYVVAHELAHLLEPSHNARFHQIVARAYADEAAARRLLCQDPWDLAAREGGNAAAEGAEGPGEDPVSKHARDFLV